MGCSPMDILRRAFTMACEAIYDFISDLISSKMFLISLCIFSILTFPYMPLWSRAAIFVSSVIAISSISTLLLINLLRLACFTVLWSFTLGKYHFWWLPNLTADCCFSDSFKPLYSHETRNFSFFGKNAHCCTSSKSISQTVQSQPEVQGKKKLL